MALLEYALATRRRGGAARLGAKRDSRSARAARMAHLRRSILARAALRLCAGALHHDVPRRRALLDRKPFLQRGGHAAARAAARRARRAAARALSGPRARRRAR